MTTATEITNRMRSLLRCEQGAMADFLVALAEVIDQQLWRELGYSSPFYYVRREFRLCAGAAQNRITAAELILWAPEVEAALRSGQLYLSTVTVVAKVLTSENKEQVLPRFYGVSRREAEQVAVAIRPAEVIPVRDVVTPLRPAASTGRAVAPATTLPMAATSDRPAAEATTTLTQGGALAFHMDETTPPVRVTVRVVQLVPEPPRDEIEPLDAKLSRLHITVDDELLQLLEASKDAFAHSFPSGRAADVIKHGLRVALAQHDKRHGLVEKPLKAPRPSRTNHIPAHVKREVLRRAGGRCEWVPESGERCDCTRMLEYDHILALALGGKSTIENVRLACRSHNLLAARQAFGDTVMDRYAPGRSPTRR
jgi:5-methylcytosine-specific restriction endonuclease McrA